MLHDTLGHVVHRQRAVQHLSNGARGLSAAVVDLPRRSSRQELLCAVGERNEITQRLDLGSLGPNPLGCTTIQLVFVGRVLHAWRSGTCDLRSFHSCLPATHRHRLRCIGHVDVCSPRLADRLRRIFHALSRSRYYSCATRPRARTN